MKARTLLALLTAVVLTACSKDPISQTQSDNPQVSVAKLFTHDGITVYRFVDAGQYVYFTSPPVDIRAKRTEYCGKGCATMKETATLAAPAQ